MLKPDASIRDAILLLRSKEGDVAAFAQVVRRWHERLRVHAYRLTGDREAAGDVVQESWVAVIRNLPKLQDVDAFPKWVFRIVTSRAIDWIRRQRRTRALNDAYVHEIDCNGHAAPHSLPEGVEQLARALDILPPEQRALVSLYYFEGFSLADIAEQLDLPPGTVKSRLHHARQRIRKLMEEQDHG